MQSASVSYGRCEHLVRGTSRESILDIPPSRSRTWDWGGMHIVRYGVDELSSVEAIVASSVSSYGIPEAVVCGRGLDLDSVDSCCVADGLLLFCAFSQQSSEANP